MSLEHEIHQKEFRNDYHKAIINILHTYNYLVGKINDLFKNYEITRQQYNVLRILRGQHPGHASIFLIRERMLDKMSDASRIVERLRLKDLVTRQYGSKDKRSVEVTITQKGLHLLDTMENEVNKLEGLLAHIDPQEIQQLNNLLDKIRAEKIHSAKEKFVV
jgi:DNA-binding MarR family transcriptional regulator